MELIEGIVIGGVALAPFVVGLVALAKKLGLPEQYAPWANGALAAAAVMAAKVMELYPQYTEYFVIVATVVMVFLSASGVHQFGKTNTIKAIKK